MASAGGALVRGLTQRLERGYNGRTMKPEAFVARLGEARASAILRCPSQKDAASAMEATLWASRAGPRV